MNEPFQIIIDVDENGKSNLNFVAKNKLNGKIQVSLDQVRNILNVHANLIERQIITANIVKQLNNMSINRDIRRKINKNLRI